MIFFIIPNPALVSVWNKIRFVDFRLKKYSRGTKLRRNRLCNRQSESRGTRPPSTGDPFPLYLVTLWFFKPKRVLRKLKMTIWRDNQKYSIKIGKMNSFQTILERSMYVDRQKAPRNTPIVGPMKRPANPSAAKTQYHHTTNDQPINQSINKSVNQSIDRSINQSINQSIDRSINQSINRSINRSINQSINQSIGG